MKNQRGFATLEIIVVILIIAVLSTSVLPNAARMLDVVRLDYEMKIFMSTLDFAKSLNKNAYYQTDIFKVANSDGTSSALQVNIATNTAYQIFRGGNEINEPHNLPKGFSMQGMNRIYFSQNNTGTLTLTSRQKFKRYIIFDSVGRWRGDITAPK